MGSEHLGDRPHHVVTVNAVPEQGAIPELADEPVQKPDRGAEKLGRRGQIDRVAADTERLKDLQMPAVQSVEEFVRLVSRAIDQKQ